MTGDLIISYNGQTTTLKNARIASLFKRDVSSFTAEELDEANRLGDEIIKKYLGDRFKAFNASHPNGGCFYFLPNGDLSFVEAAFPPYGGVYWSVTPKIAKLGSKTGISAQNC
jgi:hypothetical protein